MAIVNQINLGGGGRRNYIHIQPKNTGRLLYNFERGIVQMVLNGGGST